METKSSSMRDIQTTSATNTTMINPRRRRRSQSRKPLSTCLINFAEARREVAKALRRHRSNNIQYGSYFGRGPATYPVIDKVGGSFSNNIFPTLASPQDHHNKCCYPLVKAQVAGPTWSTTGPAVVSRPASVFEALEIDEGAITDVHESSLAASYGWWVEFLESLDGKNHQESHDDHKPNSDDGPGNLGQGHDFNFDLAEAMCYNSGLGGETVEFPSHSDDVKGENKLVNDVLNIS